MPDAKIRKVWSGPDEVVVLLLLLLLDPPPPCDCEVAVVGPEVVAGLVPVRRVPVFEVGAALVPVPPVLVAAKLDDAPLPGLVMSSVTGEKPAPRGVPIWSWKAPPLCGAIWVVP